MTTPSSDRPAAPATFRKKLVLSAARLWKRHGRSVVTTRFAVAAALLLISAASLQGVTRWFKLVLIKEPIELRHSLTSMPRRFGDYELVRREPRLPSEMEDALGTDTYITQLYRDRSKALSEPGAVVRLHVPYYTGTIDTVPHVPDRCFVAGGAQPKEKRIEQVRVDSPRIAQTDEGDWQALTVMRHVVALPGGTIPMTFVRFAYAGEASRGYTVGYFFIANNQYAATPEGVRLKAFNLVDRHAYYCKVELQAGSGARDEEGEVHLVSGVSTPASAKALMADFLAAALPEIMFCLPDWAEATGEAGPTSGGRKDPPAFASQ
ncbi:MAG: exosortase-associated EpsI family protein [Alphaproteobacteria bacterium]|jgi:hypothetical protein|nr:exosortase-associated EpsI family protein [Alphaproteobacteria bacterium]